MVGSGLQGLQLFRIQLKEHHGKILDAAVHGSLLSEKAHIADLFLSPVHVQPDHLVRPDGLFLFAEGKRLHMRVAGHIFQDALGLTEKLADVFHAAGKGRRDMPALLRKGLRLIVGGAVIPVKKYLRLLKNGEVVEIALVLRSRFTEVGKQGAADMAQLRRGRRGKLQDAVRILKDGVYERIVHPGVGINLLQPAADRQIFLDITDQILLFLVDGSLKGGGEGGGFKIVIAIQPCHLFHHVVLDGNVAGGTPSGSGNVHDAVLDLNLEAEQLKLCPNHIVGKIFPKTLCQPGKIHVDAGALQLFHIIVAVSGHLHLRVQLLEILHGERKGLIASFRVDGLLISCGSLRAVIVAQRRPADACRVEVRHLQDDPLRIGKDGILRSAHHAGQGHRAFGIGDHQIVRAQIDLLIVQKNQLFALFCLSYHDVVRDVVRVKGMGGISRRQHHIVCDVNQRVDGTHAYLPDPALHPVRGRLYLHPGHFHADISAASVRGCDLHMKIRLHIGAEGLDPGQRQIVQGSQLSRDPVMSPQIGAVRHGLVIDLKQHIV